MWNFERYRKVMGVWGAEVPLHLWKWTHFPTSLQTFLSPPLVSMVLAIPSQVLHSANEVLCTTGCSGLLTWAGLYLNQYLPVLLQSSHEGALNIQVRTGWAARKTKPLDADVFTAGVSFHSHFNPVWQSWFIYETSSTSYLQEGDRVPVCIFPLKERFAWDVKEVQKAGGWDGAAAEPRSPGGRRYLGCRGGRRSPAGSRSARTRGGRDHCCARTGDTAGCSGGRKNRGGKLQTEQTKLSQVFQHFLITQSSRILCLS